MIVNTCSRCGKQRIITKQWTETVETMRGKVKISHSDSVCPDKECQAIVAKELLVEEKKRMKRKEEKDKKDQERIAAGKLKKEMEAEEIALSTK